ncbi:MAG: RsmD family RNA methyltransferase [Rikenellaceae bacterium]
MRIVSGTHRGRLIVPPSNLKARPTTDFAKENIFNVISNFYDYEGLTVLDLFAGTGSISYEFASRGAAEITSVEINPNHVNFISSTAHKLGFDNINVVNANCFLYVKSCDRKFDVIFADPPYDIEGSEELPRLIVERGLLSDRGTLIMEHSSNLDFADYPLFTQKRKYGSVNFSIFEK